MRYDNCGNNDLRTTSYELKVFYHPEWQIAFINAEHLKGNKAELTLYKLSGEQIYKTSSNIYNGYFTFDLNMKPFSSGMYIVNLQTEKEKRTGKIVKW